MPEYEILVSSTASSLAQEDREIDEVDRQAWMKPTSEHVVGISIGCRNASNAFNRSLNSHCNGPAHFFLIHRKVCFALVVHDGYNNKDYC